MSMHCAFSLLLTLATLFSAPDIACAKDKVNKPEKSDSSELVCANGADPKNDRLYKNFKTNNASIKSAFDKYYKNRTHPTCEALQNDPAAKQISAVRAIAQIEDPPMLQFYTDNEPRPKLLKRDCIVASMNRGVINDMVTCSGKDFSSATEIKQTGRQCFTDEMVDFVQYSVNAAITCLSGSEPVDSRVIYQKLNNETGFNFSISYRGGSGIGQLTNDAIGELADPDKGRARYILQNLSNNNSELCEPFKKIATDDLKKHKKFVVDRPCDFVSAGEGVARNLIYAVGYYVYMRDNQIEPRLMKAPKVAANKEVVNALTAVAYGGEGLKKAREIMDRYRLGKNTDPKKFLAQAYSSSAYLKNIKEKIGEAYCIRENLSDKQCKAALPNLSDQELNGDACVK